MNDELGLIQVDQRVPRCARCGKMINVRGAHLSAPADDGGRLLFCSEICGDEYASLFGLTEPVQLVPAEARRAETA
jgi:hypothetical protein